ncbi:MAG: UbiA-like polyprenyltransferase [Planctomycetota bacterium]
MKGYTVMRTLSLALSDIKLAHSVFAMPFAILAGAMAVPAGASAGFVAGVLGLIVACMVLARTWAMLVNRLADAGIDAENPRTAGRVFASGRLGKQQGWLIALGCAGFFALVCAGFWLFFENPWPLVLSLPVLGWIALYSYTKRFTALCHVFLGGALAVSPVAAVIAVRPEMLWTLEPGARAVLAIAGFVLLWVAGFDVAYALQDLEFDREKGLRSIPAALGWKGSLWTSRAMHAGAFGLLCWANVLEPRFGAVVACATLGVGGLLIYEHVVLARRGLAGLPMAFFTVNGVVSVLLGAAGVLDLLV